MSSDIRVANVRVDEVLFHPHNVRRDLGDLRALAASLQRFGVMQPIIVEKNGVTMRLRAGHRRLAAARIAGLTRIPAVIHPDVLDDDEWIMASIQENVMRRDLDEAERSRAIQALFDLGCTTYGVAEAFGVSQSTIRTWADPDARRAETRPPSKKPGSVKASTVRTFASVWRAESERRQVSVDELLDAIDHLGGHAVLTGSLPPGHVTPDPRPTPGPRMARRAHDELDDAVVQRLVAGARVTTATPVERAEACRQLIAAGMTAAQIESMYGMNVHRIRKQVEVIAS